MNISDERWRELCEGHAGRLGEIRDRLLLLAVSNTLTHPEQAIVALVNATQVTWQIFNVNASRENGPVDLGSVKADGFPSMGLRVERDEDPGAGLG